MNLAFAISFCADFLEASLLHQVVPISVSWSYIEIFKSCFYYWFYVDYRYIIVGLNFGDYIIYCCLNTILVFGILSLNMVPEYGFSIQNIIVEYSFGI